MRVYVTVQVASVTGRWHRQPYAILVYFGSGDIRARAPSSKQSNDDDDYDVKVEWRGGLRHYYITNMRAICAPNALILFGLLLSSFSRIAIVYVSGWPRLNGRLINYGRPYKHAARVR